MPRVIKRYSSTNEERINETKIIKIVLCDDFIVYVQLLNMGHKHAGYNGEAACLFVSQPACGRHNFFVYAQHGHELMR